MKDKTVSVQKTTGFWLCFFVLFGALIYLLRGMLSPFVLGFILAYMLNPIVIKLQKIHFSRTWGTLVVIVGLILILLSSLLILIPLLQSQIAALVNKAPAIATALWNKIQPIFEMAKETISEAQLASIKQTVFSHATSFFVDASDALFSLFSSWGAVIDIVSFLLITPVVTFYLLADWELITTNIQNLYPRHKVAFFNQKISQIDTILSAFIRGQACVCLFLGLFYGFGLSAIGLDFGFSVGFISGIFSFIPYVGSLTGFALSLLLALTQSASWDIFIGILIVFGVGQFLEGYVLTPKLIGDKIGLHPVWVIFALFAGGALFGFIGVLIAVPAAAILGVVIRTMIECYKNSVFYKGIKKS